MLLVTVVLVGACSAGAAVGGSGGGSTPTPTLYFLMSAGGSVTQQQFAYMRPAIEAAANQWNSSARVGITIYGGQGGPGGCPNINSVSPALDNSATINTTLNAYTGTSGYSTSVKGVEAATEELVNSGVKLDTSRIIYVFNGYANSCGTGTENSATVTAVQDAYSQGIVTSIINVNTAADMSFLQQLANAGAGLDPTGTKDEPFTTATSESALENAILALGP